MRRVVVVGVAAVMILGVASCGAGEQAGSAAGQLTASASASVTATPTLTVTSTARAANPDAAVVLRTSIDLYTHCGIRTARADGVQYVADPPMDDGNGNPPRGWERVGEGEFTVYDDDTAVFDDGAGHVAWFRTRTADDPQFLCQ